MKNMYQIFFIILFLSVVIIAQQNENIKESPTDSLKLKTNLYPFTGMQLRFDEFEIYQDLYNINFNILGDSDPQTVWLRTSIAINNSKNASEDFNHHLLLPLEEKYYRDSQLSALTYVLGMVQAGAVGYLAYKSIKKYGFWKTK